MIPTVAGRRDSAVHRLDARAKLLGLLGTTVVAVSAAAHQYPVYVACAVVLAAVAAAARIPPPTIARRAAPVLPLVLGAAALLPLVREDGLTTFAEVAAKATIGTVGAILLTATTPFPALLEGLERLRVPRLFVLIAAFMVRYATVIAGETQRMRNALHARGFAPRHALAASSTGRVAGALFLRSYARGERVHRAMQSRGYEGTMPARADARALGRDDVVFLVAVAAVLAAVRLAAA